MIGAGIVGAGLIDCTDRIIESVLERHIVGIGLREPAKDIRIKRTGLGTFEKDFIGPVGETGGELCTLCISDAEAAQVLQEFLCLTVGVAA